MAEVAVYTNNQPNPDGSLPVKPRRKRVVTPKNIDKVQQEMYCKNLVPLLEAVYPQLLDKVRDGNMKAVEYTLQLLNLIKAPGGVSVVNQIYNRNQVTTPAPTGETPDGIRSFESIIRRLESVDTQVIDAQVA